MSASVGDIFHGPGEMRALCRDLEWAATPLGPTSTWPPVLRSTLALCLDSGFPILLNWGPELVAVYNDAFIPLIGGKHPEALGRSAKDLWPEAWDAVGTRLDEVLVRGRTLRFTDERQILERNGYPEECYFTFSHSPVRDADGTIVGLFTASTETTAKIVNERRLRILQQLGAVSTAEAATIPDACRAVLEVLARTRETIPFAVAVVPAGGGDDGLSTAQVVAAYGFTEQSASAAGRLFTSVAAEVLTSVSARVVTGLRDKHPGALTAGPLGPLTPDTALVLPVTVSGGADPIAAIVLGVNPYRPLDETYRAFLDLLARQVRVILSDVTAYEHERARARALADLNSAKTEFFQNVSHELRTPLTLLLGPLQELAEDAHGERSAEEDRDNARTALRAAHRLHEMVDALLDASGAQARTLTPDLQEVDLAAVTADTAAMFRSAAAEKGLHYEVSLPPGAITAVLDPAMWATVVTNLLSNAVKYTASGFITIGLRALDGEAVLTVTDTGVGIRAEEQPQVFQRFYRSRDDHRPGPGTSGLPRPGGTGIGLALVSDLVRAHHGAVALTSTPGEGSTFTVTIPLVPPNGDGVEWPAALEAAGASAGAEANATVPASLRDQHSAGEKGSGRVLVVEDDTDLRGYLTRLLASDGWQVDAAADAETAITLVTDPARPAPDLVLTDVMLPGRDGLALISELRATPSVARRPMLVLTARGGPDAITDGLATGADDYLTKPFDTAELLARVRTHHELHRRREDAVTDAEHRATQLRAALVSNRTIGTAVGVLMSTYQLNAAQGFKLLTTASQYSNRKLRDIADEVAATGRLPFRPTLVDEFLVRVHRPRP